MTHYSEEFKEAQVKKMMQPNAVSIPELAKELGISSTSLYNWRKAYQNKGIAVPAQTKQGTKWSAEDKFAVVVETISLNEADLGEYCRSKGLYAVEIKQWKQDALSGYEKQGQQKQKISTVEKKNEQKIKRLEAELRRKDKALAETATLLVLSKKCQAIWGENEED